MKKKLSLVLVIIAIVGFAYSAYAIHDTPVDGQKFYAPFGPDAQKLYDYMSKPKPWQKKWSLLPGTKELSPAKEPHGAFVTVYANDAAVKSMEKKADMPYGSLIVQENYTPDKKLESCTVMYKIKDFNSEGGDWFWVKYEAPNGYVLESGKITSCISCHSASKDKDYIFSSKMENK